MDKKLLIAFVVAIVLLAAGYWYWQNARVAPTLEEANLNQVGDSVEALNDSVTQGVLPSLDVPSNPLSDVPDVNPVTKTNPYSGVKTNPFR
jgi:cytoskeletal protein RodZ